MASLNGQTPANTYEGLLKTNDNGTLPSGADPAESITDGAGNASNLKLHQDKVDFDRIEINGNDGVQGDYLKNNGSGNLVWSQDGLAPSGYDWANTAINNRINGVDSNRIQGENWLKGYIDTEISTRTSADATLQSNIDAEASTRASADATLQSSKEDVANKGVANGYAPLDNLGKISNNDLSDDLGSRTINDLTVNGASEFNGLVYFEQPVFFNSNTINTGSSNFSGFTEFDGQVRFDNTSLFQGDITIQGSTTRFGATSVAHFQSTIKDSLNNFPSADGQVLLSVGSKLQWGSAGGGGGGTDTGTYTVNSKEGTANYSPTSSSGAYAVTGDVVKCSGYIQPNATIYIQSFLYVQPPNTSPPPIRLTSLPFPAATIENNIGYEVGVGWFGVPFISAVRGGTLGSWVITDASGTQYGSGAIVGVIDKNTNNIYDVAIYFAGATGQISIANNQFLKFDFEYIKS
jgi:hypothetical protein